MITELTIDNVGLGVPLLLVVHQICQVHCYKYTTRMVALECGLRLASLHSHLFYLKNLDPLTVFQMFAHLTIKRM